MTAQEKLLQKRNSLILSNLDFPDQIHLHLDNTKLLSVHSLECINLYQLPIIPNLVDNATLTMHN